MSKNNPPQPAHDAQGPQEPRPSNPTRRDQAARVLRDQQRRDRRRKMAVQGGVAVAVVAIVLGTTIGLLSGDDERPTASTPPGLTADGAVRFGADDAPVVVQAVEDFQCPACQQFEQASGDLLASYHEGDEVAVEYRPIAFLDRASTTNYSTRALNASMCVLEDTDEDGWLAYHEALFANQPAEGGAGLPDEQLVTMANDVGASDDVAACIEDQAYGDWTKDQTQTVLDEGVSSTPTLFVNDEPIEAIDPESIRAAVQAAANGS